MKKKEIKVLEEIQARGWAKFGDDLFQEVWAFPVERQMIEHAKRDINKVQKVYPDIDLDKLETIQATGRYDEKKREEVPEVAEAFRKWMEDEIKLAIKMGKLKDPEKDKYVKKTKQLGKRARSKEARSNNQGEGEDTQRDSDSEPTPSS